MGLLAWYKGKTLAPVLVQLPVHIAMGQRGRFGGITMGVGGEYD